MEYIGKISAIGNKSTRKNEITADDLAVLRNYCFGNSYGVIDKQGYNFEIIRQETNSITMSKGIAYAYGYVGYVETSTFYFIRPSVPQYHILYLELNKSVVPNTCALKIKNNQSIRKIDEYTLRQDMLSVVKTGIFQVPLYVLKLNVNGIEEITDVRPLKKCMGRVENAEGTSYIIGEIASNAIYVANENYAQDKTSQIVASVGMVNTIIINAINRHSNEVVGSWVFNDNLAPLDDTRLAIEENLTFISNATEYNSIKFSYDIDDGWQLQYDTRYVYLSFDGWSSSNMPYKTITIENEQNLSSEFIAWLQTNATHID